MKTDLEKNNRRQGMALTYSLRSKNRNLKLYLNLNRSEKSNDASIST
jgi:hypothetical protein